VQQVPNISKYQGSILKIESKKRKIERTLEENCSAWIEDYSSEIYEEEYQPNEKGEFVLVSSKKI
jgi:hypothetical protein